MSAGASAATSRERAQVARREGVMEAAEQVFAERGYAQATVAAIAERAGYSAGNLYNFFDSKESLFREVVRWRGEVLLERIDAALATPGAFAARLDALFDVLVSFVAEHRPFFVIYVHTTSGCDVHPELPAEGVLAVQERIEARLVQALVQGMDAGEIVREEPAVVSQALLGALSRCLARWIQHGGDVEALREGAVVLRRVLRRALGLPAAAAAAREGPA